MTIIAARPFGVRFGNLQTDRATAVVMSRAPETVQLTVNGTNYSVVLAACGNDRSAADPSGSTILGYTGNVTVFFPKPFTKYPWSATQNGVSLSADIRSAPLPGSDFAVGLVTCTKSLVIGNASSIAPNAYHFLENYRRTSSIPYIATVHADDIMYPDGGGIGGLETFTADPNGKMCDSQVVRSKYNFAFYYGHWFGIIGPIDYNLSNRIAALGNDSDFLSLYDNSAVHVGFGDHEFVNNLGWAIEGGTDGAQLATVPNPYHATANGYNGTGLVTWNQIMKPLQGQSIGTLDTNAQHWKLDLGDLRIVTVDPITRAVSSAGVPQSCLGNNQIDDCLNSLNSAHPFKILHVSGWTGRFMSAYFANHASTYLDKSWQNYVAAEYDRMFRNTGQTPKALMDNSRTNGLLGNLVVASGDWHDEQTLYHRLAASAGKAAEDFQRIGLCQTHSPTTNPALPIIPMTADETGDSFVCEGAIAHSSATTTNYAARATVVEVFGSETPKRMRVRQWALLTPGPNNTPVANDMLAAYIRNTAGPVSLGDITDHNGSVWRCYFDKHIAQWDGNRGAATKKDFEIPATVARRAVKEA